jgi:hypothetical protein
MAPVALRVNVAQDQLLLLAERDFRDGARDLARDKRFTTARAFVVEENTVARVHVVRLTVVDHNPVPVELGHA